MAAVTGEFAALARVAAALPSAPEGETWIGDDTAVLGMPDGPWLLLAADTVVAGVHADLALTGLDDLGWKAMVANLSDVAAMGGRPGHAVVSVAGPAGTDLDLLYDGIAAAAVAYGCPVVGGDLSNSPALVVTVAVTGTVEGAPVLRSGARPGDGIWLTGPLGASAAGLRDLRQRAAGSRPRSRPGIELRLHRAHARPIPALAEGYAARLGGARAMIDVSDGLAADLCHVADASGVGFLLDRVPVAAGATLADALGGGEDYALVFCAPDPTRVADSFRSAGVAAPELIGTCIEDPALRRLGDESLEPAGWEHRW